MNKNDRMAILAEEWRLKMSMVDFKERYSALGLEGYNEKNLPISYFCQEYEIDRSDFNIYYVGDRYKEVDVFTKFAIYHLFYFSKETPVNSGIFVPLYEIKPAAPFYKAFNETVILPFAAGFNGRKKDLVKAISSLGFIPIPESDAGFEAAAFSCFPIRYLFWEGDDEFPAQANILFDKNVLEFTHEETIITMASDGVKLLINSLL